MINTEAGKKYRASVLRGGTLGEFLPEIFRPDQKWWYETRGNKAARIKGWERWGEILRKRSEDHFAAELIYQLDHEDISSVYNIFYFMKHFMKWIKHPRAFLSRTDIREAMEERTLKQLAPGRGTRASSARFAALTVRAFAVTLGRGWIVKPVLQDTARRRIEFMLTLIPLLAGTFLNLVIELKKYNPEQRNSTAWYEALSEKRRARKTIHECVSAIQEVRTAFLIPAEEFRKMVDFAISVRAVENDRTGAGVLRQTFLTQRLPQNSNQT